MTDTPIPDKVLVHYPGHHGAETATTMRNPKRGMRWKAGQVRLVPLPEAGDYIRLSGYYRALTAAEVQERYGLTEAALAKLSDRLTTATWEEGEQPTIVFVLDRQTAAELRLAATGKKRDRAAARESAATNPTP